MTAVPVSGGASSAAIAAGGAVPRGGATPLSSSSSKKSSSSSFLPQRVAARLTGSPWFWAAFVAVAFALPIVRSLNRPLPPAPPATGVLPAFSLTDQYGKPVTDASLRGTLVLAEFVSAKRLSGRPTPLAELQKRVRNTGQALRLVSFVDETPGSPPLADLAAHAGAAAPRWTLAGGDLAPVEAAIRKAAGGRADVPLYGYLLLADAHGRVRRIEAPTPDNVDLIMRDIGLLANMEGL
jgi:protein SCO1